MASLTFEGKKLAIPVGGQADGRGEAVAPGVKSQGQAKNLEELAVVARFVGEEFAIHEGEYTSGLGVCKQISQLFFRCALAAPGIDLELLTMRAKMPMVRRISKWSHAHMAAPYDQHQASSTSIFIWNKNKLLPWRNEDSGCSYILWESHMRYAIWLVFQDTAWTTHGSFAPGNP